MPNIVNEPRAFWSVEYQTPTAIDVPVTVRFNREHFRNGGRWPIVLEHFLIAPIGYTLVTYDGANDPPTANADRHDCAAAIQVSKLLITQPNRRHLSLYDLLTVSWGDNCPSVFDPGMDPSDARAGVGYASGLLGVYRWDFRPSQQPRGYGVDFGLGGVLIQPADIGALITGANIPVANIGFYEAGGQFKGNARTFRSSNADISFIGSSVNFPFPPDGLGAPASNPTRAWPVNVPASEYRKVQQSQAGSEFLTGFAVHLDQVGYDDQVQKSLIANVAGQPVASLALRCPTRCRTVGGVTDTWWWREGAPLALVTPSRTPAQVYKLKRPFVLHPGDVLDVELEVPGGFLSTPSDLIFPTYQVGVSFTGYAIIEG